MSNRVSLSPHLEYCRSSIEVVKSPYFYRAIEMILKGKKYKEFKPNEILLILKEVIAGNSITSQQAESLRKVINDKEFNQDMHTLFSKLKFYKKSFLQEKGREAQCEQEEKWVNHFLYMFSFNGKKGKFSNMIELLERFIAESVLLDVVGRFYEEINTALNALGEPLSPEKMEGYSTIGYGKRYMLLLDNNGQSFLCGILENTEKQVPSEPQKEKGGEDRMADLIDTIGDYGSDGNKKVLGVNRYIFKLANKMTFAGVKKNVKPGKKIWISSNGEPIVDISTEDGGRGYISLETGHIVIKYPDDEFYPIKDGVKGLSYGDGDTILMECMVKGPGNNLNIESIPFYQKALGA